jgi:hypothetical protein
MSKFKALFEEANQAQPSAAKDEGKSAKGKKDDAVKTPAGRKKGKRSDPNFTGVFAYVPVKLHEDVMVNLVRRKDLDFSGLVEQLLNKWLKEQK